MSTYTLEHRCAQALAREAGKRILIERSKGIEIGYKGTNDLVTNVDRSIERFIREQLRDMFPEDGINGEEYGKRDVASNGRVWLVDPIDGTTNFSKGIPVFCVSIALQVNKQTVVGAIYDPNRQELFSAQLGYGAWLNGNLMQVSQEQDLKQAVVITGFPPRRDGDDIEAITARLTRVVMASRGLRRMGSAALDLANVAAGRFDAYWEFSLNPWDTAAGYLMVQEAGGQVTDAQGDVFDAHNPSVVATNGLIHDALRVFVQEL